MYKNKHHQLIISFFLGVIFILSSCQEDPSRHINLGDWYLQRDLIDEAIMEYREVSRLYSGEQDELERDEFQILGKAHLKLAIAYTKKGWWEYALREAENSFDLSPSPDTHELVELIKEKIELQNKKSSS